MEQDHTDLNERDNSASAANLFSAHIVLSDLHKERNHESQKSLERGSNAAMSTNSRNAHHVGTAGMAVKSPLLLQKKQQMIIQKTKEPCLTAVML